MLFEGSIFYESVCFNYFYWVYGYYFNGVQSISDYSDRFYRIVLLNDLLSVYDRDYCIVYDSVCSNPIGMFYPGELIEFRGYVKY